MLDNIYRIEEILESDDSVFNECWHHWVSINRYHDEEQPENWKKFSDKTKLIFHVEQWELI